MWSVNFILLASAFTSTIGVDDDNSKLRAISEDLTMKNPDGDPWICVRKAKAQGLQLENFEVLPGYGWDNLRNVVEGQVVSFNYTQCRTTDDGRFLIPDSVSVLPLKFTDAQFFAELIEHWTKWTSSDSWSINVDAGFHKMFTEASGKFSLDFSNVKSKQSSDKSVTTRTQLKYTRYSVQLQPDTQMHPVFMNRILTIASSYAQDYDDRGNFLCELLVRDFGTHIVTKAVAGASLVQMDFLDSEWVKQQVNSNKKFEIMAAASAKLFQYLDISFHASLEYKADESFVDEYTSKKTSSNIFTNGGPLLMPSNFTADTWAASVDKHLVAVDRAGDPLYYVITQEALPSIPPHVVTKVYNGVKRAVDAYYSNNMIPGCLDPESPHFTPNANVDDESCEKALGNLTFGGVYQTCTMKETENGDLCENLRQVNPLSRGESCPKGFTSVKLNSGSTSSSRDETICEGILIWRKCHVKHFVSTAEYDMFWCAAASPLPSQSGFQFGGVFTSTKDNPLVGDQICPIGFYPLKIGDQSDLKVCVGDDQAQKQAMTFGGFFSCSVGNPVVIHNQPNQKGSLRAFYQDKQSDWPKRCPPSFSAHHATVDQDCEIKYCIHTASLPPEILPRIKRPPFSPDPVVPPPLADEFRFDPVSHTWTIFDQ